MAAYVSVPRDLARVKSRILFNLTRRQLVCFGAAVLVGVPSFFGIRQLTNTSLAALAMILIMMPFFLLAMYEKDGQPLEVIAAHFIRFSFLRPRVRPYETDCFYAALGRQAEVYKEVDAIVCEKHGPAGRESHARAEEADPGSR